MRVISDFARCSLYLERHGLYSPRWDDVVLGVERDGVLVGAVAYADFNGASMQMHCAGEGAWLSRRVLRHLFDYPFNVARCRVVIATVPATNARALSLNARLGFREVGRVPDAYPDADMVVMAMRRSECRWIGEDHGETTKHAAACA